MNRIPVLPDRAPVRKKGERGGAEEWGSGGEGGWSLLEPKNAALGPEVAIRILISDQRHWFHWTAVLSL